MCCHLLVSRGTDIDTPRMAARFKLAGQCHIVPKQAITWHFNPDHTCQYRTCVDTYPQLREKERRMKMVGEDCEEEKGEDGDSD